LTTGGWFKNDPGSSGVVQKRSPCLGRFKNGLERLETQTCHQTVQKRFKNASVVQKRFKNGPKRLKTVKAVQKRFKTVQKRKRATGRFKNGSKTQTCHPSGSKTVQRRFGHCWGGWNQFKAGLETRKPFQTCSRPVRLHP